MIERLRDKPPSSAIAWLALALAVGCGSSVKNDHDGDSGTTGGNAGERGGSSGSSSGGSSAQGGSNEGGSTQGGSAGSGGSSAQGGSSEGGSTQGGSAGAGGEGGDGTIPTRVFLQTGNALVATDPETLETVELCPDAGTEVRFLLVDWVSERAIVLRQTFTPSSSELLSAEILRVALDGSECATLIREEANLIPFPPVAGERIVLGSGLDGATGEVTLVGLPIDGSPPDAIAPNVVVETPRIAGDRVLFQRVLEDSTTELVSALADGSSMIALVPDETHELVGLVRGNRVIVNSGDVHAVDADGGNLVTLAMNPEDERAVAFVENRVIIARHMTPVNPPNRDLLIVDENGGELTPLASSNDDEVFRGSAGDRVIYERTLDLYSVRLDGSEPRTVTETPGVVDNLSAFVDDRVVYCNSVGDLKSCFNVAADGSDRISLHQSATGFGAVAGDRVVLYVGTDQQDLVSVPMTGGQPFLLADSPEPDRLVGRIGTLLVIQRGEAYASGEVLRIEADGSRGAVLAPVARYLGSISEICGLHRAGADPDCAE
jgi:hypothetical protein